MAFPSIYFAIMTARSSCLKKERLVPPQAASSIGTNRTWPDRGWRLSWVDLGRFVSAVVLHGDW